MKIKMTYLLLLVVAFTLLIARSPQAAADDTPDLAVESALQQSDPLARSPELVSEANCRFGATIEETTAGISTLDLGWFLNFSSETATTPSNGAEFAHMIRVKQNKTSGGTYLPTFTISPPLTASGLGATVSANPGALWLVGNEPDRGPNPGETDRIQDDTFPDVYANAYHDTYHYIKQIDPTAQVAIAGLVEVTPGRLAYLDLVWNAYRAKYNIPMPVDVWNMHIYILSETNPDGTPNGIANVALGTSPALGKRSPVNSSECSQNNVYCIAEHDDINIFKEHVVAMRTWMKAHGQQYKPLILTEFSSLFSPTYPDGTPFRDEFGNQFTIARIEDFMDSTVDYMLSATDSNLGYPYDGNHLVQQWAWFSTFSSSIGWGSNLLKADKTTLSQLGNAYQSHIDADPYDVDLLIGARLSSIGPIQAGVADVQLSADIYNNGSKAETTSITVNFYKDAALTQPIGSTITIPTDLRGCARVHLTASTTWANLTPGKYTYWVKVTPASGETNTSNNVSSGVFLIDQNPTFAPVILKN